MCLLQHRAKEPALRKDQLATSSDERASGEQRGSLQFVVGARAVGEGGVAQEFELLKRVMLAKNLKWQGEEMYLVSAVLRAIGEAGVGGAVAGSGLVLGYWGRAKTPGVVFGLQRNGSVSHGLFIVCTKDVQMDRRAYWFGEQYELG